MPRSSGIQDNDFFANTFSIILYHFEEELGYAGVILGRRYLLVRFFWMHEKGIIKGNVLLFLCQSYRERCH